LSEGRREHEDTADRLEREHAAEFAARKPEVDGVIATAQDG